MSKKSSPILLLLLGIGTLQAQNISTDTLTWKVISATNQADQSQFGFSCSFITYGANAVDWSQNDGQAVSNYTVTAADGQWTDVTKEGTVALGVQNGNITGTLTFARSNGNATVHLQLLVKGKLNQDYVFAVSSINSGH